jgi:folylpolyglutamate synthase/dihydrofolate synthase
LLSRLPNFERTRPNQQVWDLATIRAILGRTAAAPKRAPAVQVGGSKGKGTTCACLAALAQSAGRRAGLFLSPHTETLLERIQVDGRNIDVAELEARLRDVLAFCAARALRPTFFEAMTAVAVDEFAARAVDLGIFEVGLGGRFDATTAVPVDASILTVIELEHTELLGDTVAKIAAEKAPVIRPGGIGFTAVTGDALTVVERHARDVGARLAVLDRDFGLADVLWEPAGVSARLRLPDGRVLPLRLPDARAYELPAFALASAAMAELLPQAPLHLDPAPRPFLPCRFEILPQPDGMPVILDGAHTEASLRAVAVELQRRWPGQKVAVLFSSATGKRWREGLSALLPFADRVLVTELKGTVSEDPHVIAAWLRQRGVRTELAPTVPAGCEQLLDFAGPRLVAGSFYLAGEARRFWTSYRPPR